MTIHQPSFEELVAALSQYRQFARLGEAFITQVAQRMEWSFLPGGQTLFEQGERADCLYVVLGGRLRVYSKRGGKRVPIGEVSQGESVGELALLTGGRRTATVVALRDTYLVSLSNASFQELTKAFPSLTLQVALFIGRRLKRYIHDHSLTHSISNFAVVGMSQDVDTTEFSIQLTEALNSLAPARFLSPREIQHQVGEQWPRMSDNIAFNRYLGDWLNDLERDYRYLVYQCVDTDPGWTARAIRQADCVLMVANGDGRPKIPQDVPWEMMDVRNVGRRELILMHRPEVTQPSGTLPWLELLPETDHHHIRWNNREDFKRLARLVTGNALGLVLGGGGARGFAHIGVIRAFQERQIPIDMIGGTSMGALIGAQLAIGWDLERIRQACRHMFVETKIWDYTLPLIALTRGKRFERLGEEMFGDLQVEDMLKSYFCITANLSRAEQMVHRSGLLRHWLAATTALPGLLPPQYHNGELLVDGGLMNNVPVDVMDATNRGSICAVDVSPAKDVTLKTTELASPSPWRLLLNRLFRGKMVVPGIMNVMVRSATLTNVEGLRKLKDHIALYINPPMQEVAMLDWDALDEVADLGYQYTLERLENFTWPPKSARRRH